MLSACFVLWCLGSPLGPDQIRLVTAQDVYQNAGANNRLVTVDGRWLIGGYVFQPDTRDVIFAGVVPVRLRVHSRVELDGGAIFGTGELPRRGTLLNWLARARVRLTDQIAFEYVHVSNGGLRDIANPAIDSIGVSVRLR